MRSNGACDQERVRVERLCRENGWSVDERDGDDCCLYFNSSFADVRRVRIARGDQALVIISVMSFALLPAQNVPPEVLGYMLERNAEIVLGGWRMVVTDEGQLAFMVTYVAMGLGLNAGLFKHICETLNHEAHEFDVKMQRAGLL